MIEEHNMAEEPDMKDLRMHAAEKELWLAALESGEFPQSTRHLYDGKGYCCLGVLAKAKGATFVPECIDVTDEDGEDEEGNAIEVESGEYHAELGGREINDSDLLADDWAEAACGLSNDHMALLAHLNDGTQWTISPTHPMFELSRKLGSEEPSQSKVGWHTFKFKRHSFAEIAAVIRENF